MSEAVETSFRRESARLVSSLTRRFGPAHFALVEDVVQEAFLRALRQWPAHGTPPNPSAWLFRVAKNLALDRLRRDRILVSDDGMDPAFTPREPDELPDDELRMLFLCCHPRLAPESQIALTLKSLAGFSTTEVARAMLVREEAVSQRILRARKALANETFDLPSDVAERLDPVLKVIYLIFNEGYSATSGPSPIRGELCFDAIYLAEQLQTHPRTRLPKVHALLALMYLHASRFPARSGPDDAQILLEFQDRSRWSSELTSRGLSHLERSANGAEVSVYHCEAAIAACHAVAPSYEETDWRSILWHYDHLLEIAPSDVVRLNRAMALGMVYGPHEAIGELNQIECLSRYPLFWASRARLADLCGRDSQEDWKRALDLATSDADREFYRQRVVG